MDGVRRPRRRRVAALALGLGLSSLVGVTTLTTSAARADDDSDTALYLVTLEGPGTAGLRGPAAHAPDAADDLLAEQDDVLATVDASEPVYRWTTALNGFAVALDADDARILADDPRVALVERDAVVPLASATQAPAGAGPGHTDLSNRPADRLSGHLPNRSKSGAGTVIGFVDTGIDPGSRAFSVAAPLGVTSDRFRGDCADAPDDPRWAATDCTAKVVGAQYFVEAFGPDRLRAAAVLSPFDTDGHGTQMASIAAGVADVAVRAGGRRLGRFAGVAPRARVAAYKACWSAPDPSDDGCATADVVAAIDQATADRVDVLNLSMGGPGEIDTVERALLGAVEQGIVVTAAAGNRPDRTYAAHPAPWVVTVGATTGADRTGEVVAGRRRLHGAMASTGSLGPAPLVLGSRAVAPGATTNEARHCLAGSLDAAEVAGAVVVCRRGAGARVEKSRTVALAGGVGMVLVNRRPGSTDPDLHGVPTVHLSETDGRRLLRWARHRTRPVVSLVSRGVERGRVRVAPFSNAGDPTSTILKPDLVAPGTEVLAAVPGGWDLVSGTSPASAHVAGVAAVLLGRRGAEPAEVRSALLTTADRLTGAAAGLRAGAGRARIAPAPPLAYLVRGTDYRAWLEGDRADLDAPQALLSRGRLRLRRTLTNVGTRPLEVTAHASGFAGAVTVSPANASLRPGQRLRFTITVAAAPGRTDDGIVHWHADDGSSADVPVVVTR